MTGQQEDEPPKAAGMPVRNWDEAIAAQGGPQPHIVEAPPGTSVGVDESPFVVADELAREQLADRKHTRNLREVYADKAYALAFSCLWGWGAMLVASGLVNSWRGEPLWSDKVLIAVTTGVTVSVLAVFLGVIRGLFPNGNGSGGKEK